MRIPLTKGYHAIVDDCDAWVANHKWFADVDKSGIVYACRTGPRPARGKIRMHRGIMGAKPGEEIDHTNLNGLDNRRRNLRVCTHAQNQQNSPKPRHNTSGFKGVSFHKRSRKWQAQIEAGRSIYLGSFSTPREAHAAYVKAARRLFGAFARAA